MKAWKTTSTDLKSRKREGRPTLTREDTRERLFQDHSRYLLVTLEDIQLSPGSLRVFVHTVHILQSGEIAFECNVFAGDLHRWKLVRMDSALKDFHSGVVVPALKASPQVATPQTGDTPEKGEKAEKIPFFLKKWIKSKDGAKCHGLCKTTPQGSAGLMNQPEKYGPIEELRVMGQTYFDTVFKRFPQLVVNPQVKLFLDPANEPATWFLARNSKLRGTLEVDGIPERYCVLFAGRIYVYASLEEKIPLFFVDLLCAKIEQVLTEEGEPTNAFEIIEKQTKQKHVFACKVITRVTEWVRLSRKARDMRPQKVTETFPVDIPTQSVDYLPAAEIPVRKPEPTAEELENFRITSLDAYKEEAESAKNVVYNSQGDKITFATMDQILDKVVYQNFEREVFDHLLRRLLYSQEVSKGASGRSPLSPRPAGSRVGAAPRLSTVSGGPRPQPGPRIDIFGSMEKNPKAGSGVNTPSQDVDLDAYLSILSNPSRPGSPATSMNSSGHLVDLPEANKQPVMGFSIDPPSENHNYSLEKLLADLKVQTPGEQSPLSPPSPSLKRGTSSLGDSKDRPAFKLQIPSDGDAKSSEGKKSEESPSNSSRKLSPKVDSKKTSSSPRRTVTVSGEMSLGSSNSRPTSGERRERAHLSEPKSARDRANLTDSKQSSSSSLGDKLDRDKKANLSESGNKQGGSSSSLNKRTSPGRPSRKSLERDKDFTKLEKVPPPVPSIGSSPATPGRTKKSLDRDKDSKVERDRSESRVERPVNPSPTASPVTSKKSLDRDKDSKVERDRSASTLERAPPPPSTSCPSTPGRSRKSLDRERDSKVERDRSDSKMERTPPASPMSISQPGSAVASPTAGGEHKPLEQRSQSEGKGRVPKLTKTKSDERKQSSVSQGQPQAAGSPRERSKSLLEGKNPSSRSVRKNTKNISYKSSDPTSEQTITPPVPDPRDTHSLPPPMSNDQQKQTAPDSPGDSRKKLPVKSRTVSGPEGSSLRYSVTPTEAEPESQKLLAYSKTDQILEFIAWWLHFHQRNFRKSNIIVLLNKSVVFEELGLQLSDLGEGFNFPVEDAKTASLLPCPVQITLPQMSLGPGGGGDLADEKLSNNNEAAYRESKQIVTNVNPLTGQRSTTLPRNTITIMPGDMSALNFEEKVLFGENFFPRLSYEYAANGKGDLTKFYQYAQDLKNLNTTQALPTIFKPLLPTVYSTDGMQVFDLSSKEIAKQLAIMSLALIKTVQPAELIHWGTKKKDCPNLSLVVENFNSLCQWAKTFIVTGGSVKQRAYYIMKIIAITHHSIAFKNFHVIYALKTALNQIAISRLKKSWALVSEKAMTRFQGVEKLMDPEGNWKVYRERMKTGFSKPPFIPYMGLLLQDLLFIDDGNQTYKTMEDGAKLVNWEKCVLMGGLVRKFVTSSDYSYPFVYLPEVAEVLNEALKTRIDEDKEIYRMSVALEAKAILKSRAQANDP